jgi:hypothetical protein
MAYTTVRQLVADLRTDAAVARDLHRSLTAARADAAADLLERLGEDESVLDLDNAEVEL